MHIFGKGLSEYVAFTRLFLGLILVVGIVRLALSFGGVPNSTAKWLSITAVVWIGVLYYSIRVHTSRFGSYKQLLPIYVLQGLVAQAIIVPAIVIAILTGSDNIYSAPEYSFGGDGKTWLHAGAHLVLGTTIGPLVGWLVACLIMFATKKLVKRGKDTKAAARA
ncbi:MAG: hypothetical protein HY574_14555 [candidate division NC10 bacterium]|nr:hypothetical protein [candidate division NC10 bacterium]